MTRGAATGVRAIGSRDACHVIGGLVAVLTLACAARAQSAQPSSVESPARDLHEEIVHIDVKVADLYGRSDTVAMPITIYRPDGKGPYPLVIFNHGRAPTAQRAKQGRSHPEALARYLVSKGLVVLAPTRIGYWESYGAFDPEDTGHCNDLRLDAMVQSATDEVLATVAFAKTLPYVDATRWIVAGQSVGGLVAIATVGRKPENLLGGINFAGGTGGDPDAHPGRPCDPRRVEALYRRSGAASTVPMVWMYWANDHFWGEAVPRAWFSGWQSAGGHGEFDQFAARGDDGHNGMNTDLDHWVPVVDGFLATLGFPRSPPLERPASTDVRVDDVARLPATSPELVAAYRRFLDLKAPRAFAIGDRGAFGFATKDAVTMRALGFCEHTGQHCKVYAVDDAVVWH